MHEINSRVSRYLPVSPKNPVAWHSSIKVSAPYFSAKSHSSLSEEPPQVHVNWRLVQGVARKIQYIFTKYFLLYQFLYFPYLSGQTKLKNVIYKWLNWNSAKKFHLSCITFFSDIIINWFWWQICSLYKIYHTFFKEKCIFFTFIWFTKL